MPEKNKTGRKADLRVKVSEKIKTAEGIILPADTKLEMVEFIGIGKTSKTTITSNTIFYYHSNSWSDTDSLDTLQEDVTLALADVNSISFFAYWGRSIK